MPGTHCARHENAGRAVARATARSHSLRLGVGRAGRRRQDALPARSVKGGNVLASLPVPLPSEAFETIVKHSTVRIERILSQGHVSPECGWYDQDEHEWVMVLRGRGHLEFEDGEEITLEAGGWIEIPAHRKHRVAWTEPDEVTVWLAVFYRDPD